MNSKIIKALIEKKGYISGEALSTELGVSRAAVWKHIEELRRKGFEIESSPKKGYILKKTTDRIDTGIIKNSLKTDFIGKNMEVFDSIDSTNDEAKRRTSANFDNGLVIISEIQTAGRGRLGRIWESPKNKGVWMSVLFNPTELEPNHGSRLTLLAAVAIVKAIENQLGDNLKNLKDRLSIKWPNDILFNGKKICGILTEMGADIDRINWLVLGMGINVLNDSEDFPSEIREIATSLKILTGQALDRNILIASILNELEELYIPFKKTGELTHFIDFYRERSLVPDRKLLIHRRGEITECVGVTVTDEGFLRVRHNDGHIEDVFFGEVSVREALI